MRGRKPKPSHLRVIEGNRGKRRLNAREPRPLGDLHEAPEWFTDAQRDVWTYAIANAPAGLLKRLDRDVMAGWCVACEMHRRATMQQAKIDAASGLPLLTRSPEGHLIQSPYLPIINRQAVLMAKFAAELGFSPSSRSRIQIEQDADAGTKADSYFAS